MARTAKKRLTIDELLNESYYLLTVAPFQVPQNWSWTTLRRITTHQSGNSKLIKGKLASEMAQGLYPGYSASGQDVFCPDYEHEGEAVIVSAVGARCGKAFYTNGKWNAIANTHIVYPTDAINGKYLYYLLNNEEWWVKSGSAQPFVVVNESLERPFPLPPLAEQQRIVDRIESLFAKLDEAKEKAQAVVDGFEDRRAVILHKAFTGELTEAQRKKQGDGYDGWESVTLNDIVNEFKYGTSEKSDYSFTGMPVLRIPNIGDDGIDFSDIKKLSSETVEAANQIHENDILIIRSNGSRDLVGKCALVPQLDQEYAYASFLIRIKPSERVRAEYLVLFLNSADARAQMFAKAKSSAGINNINSKELGAVLLKLPELWEQEEITHQVSKLLLLEKQAKEAAEQVIDQIDAMKKSILARAFRGELGTNDPNDESAVELLKRVL